MAGWGALNEDWCWGKLCDALFDGPAASHFWGPSAGDAGEAGVRMV